jgi:hypothetical protein
MGGWLFDQAMAGSDAVVLTSDRCETKAAAILGARAYDLEAGIARLLPGAGLQAVALPADLYDRDSRVRVAVLDALHQGSAEIMFSGDALPSQFERMGSPVRYQLTIAARAFKAYAIAASPSADCGTHPGPAGAGQFVETFSRVRIRHPQPISL